MAEDTGTFNGTDEGLKTIQGDVVPECRMASATAVQDFVRRLIQDDEKRSRKRAKVNGLVDGNSPYNPSKLRSASRGDAANVNAGTGRSYMEAASGALYDLFNEAPGHAQIETEYGNEEQKLDYSRGMSLETDVLFSTEREFDDAMQLSQLETTLHGHGPLFFENEHKVFPMAIEDADLLLPDLTRSTSELWEAAAICWNYYPPQLYESIQNPQAATAVGWNVEFTRKVIEEAMDVQNPDNQQRAWEFFQTQLKTNSLEYVGHGNKVCKVAHVFWREFNNRITHSIVEREDSTGKGTQYLFLKVGRYDNFRQAIHAMYFDRGRGGYHHSVTGLGTKMYSLMEFENRLFCNLLDKAFSPKILFKPTTAEAKEKFQMARFGDYGLIPAGTEAIQSPIQGFLTDGLAMFRTSSELARSNLSQYRQPSKPDQPGNPDTALEVRSNMAQQSALSGTVFSRYYRQLDALYEEIVRRLCNLNTTDERAKEWQRRCMERGIPRECFGRIKSVKAVRVMGQGSPFLRSQVTTEIMPVIGRCSEEGQNSWLNDYIASRAGQSAVNRYNPQPTSSKMASDQQFQATGGIVMAKIGVPPPVTATQNATVFASTYLKAAVDSLQSVQRGGNPNEVLAFLHTIGPAIAAHLKRLEQDPLRKQVFDALKERFDQLAKLTDKLDAAVKATAAKAKAQNQKAQGAMSDLQIKAAVARGNLTLKKQKQDATLAMQRQKHQQGLMIADSNTASQIALQHARTVSDIHNSRMKSLKAFKE